MKLYATVTNSKGKKEGIGDDTYLEATISIGNTIIGRVIAGLINGDYLICYYPVGKEGRTVLYSSGWEGQKQKGEFKCDYCDETFIKIEDRREHQHNCTK